MKRNQTTNSKYFHFSQFSPPFLKHFFFSFLFLLVFSLFESSFRLICFHFSLYQVPLDVVFLSFYNIFFSFTFLVLNFLFVGISFRRAYVNFALIFFNSEGTKKKRKKSCSLYKNNHFYLNLLRNVLVKEVFYFWLQNPVKRRKKIKLKLGFRLKQWGINRRKKNSSGAFSRCSISRIIIMIWRLVTEFCFFFH